MDVDEFVKALEDELEKRHQVCEDGAMTPCDILMAVLNSVTEARKKALKGFTGR